MLLLVPSFKVIAMLRLATELSPSAAVLLLCTPEVRTCACASCETLMAYLPATVLPEVVALNAVELLAAVVAVNRSALFSLVLAAWKVVSELFRVA